MSDLLSLPDNSLYGMNSSVTIKGMRFILQRMRWTDLEAMASEIEAIRKGNSKSGRAKIQAKHLIAWAMPRPIEPK